MVAYQTAQVGHGDGRRKKSKTGENGSYHTAQVGPGDRGRKKSKKWIEYDLDLIWIEIGVLISRNELSRPVLGTIFLVTPVVIWSGVHMFVDEKNICIVL